jgi:hypothetical protein
MIIIYSLLIGIGLAAGVYFLLHKFVDKDIKTLEESKAPTTIDKEKV